MKNVSLNFAAVLFATTLFLATQQSVLAQRAESPRFKVLFVYNKQSPKDSLQHKTFDTSKEPIDQKTVTTFNDYLEEKAPQYRSYLKDVELSKGGVDLYVNMPNQAARLLIERETNRVNALQEESIAGVKTAVPSAYVTPGVNGNSPAIQRLRVIGGLLNEFKIYDANGNRLTGQAEDNYSTAIPESPPKTPRVSPLEQIKREFEGPLMQQRNKKRDLGWDYDNLGRQQWGLNERATSLRDKESNNESRLNKYNDLLKKYNEMLDERDRYAASMQSSFTVTLPDSIGGTSRTYTSDTYSPYLNDLNEKLQNTYNELINEGARINQSAASTSDLQQRLNQDQAAVNSRRQQLDAIGYQNQKEEARIHNEIEKRLNSKSYGDHD